MWQTAIAILDPGRGGAPRLVPAARPACRAPAADAAAHRREAVDGVTELVAALADHRRAVWLREEARLAGGDWREARAASRATRAAITAWWSSLPPARHGDGRGLRRDQTLVSNTAVRASRTNDAPGPPSGPRGIVIVLP